MVTSPGLDGARALATLSVFFFHALWRTPALEPLRPLLGHADIGVEVFFILSGFLVTRPLVAHAVRGARPVRATDFWRRRIARIWPAYLVALVGSVLIGVGTIDDLSGWIKHGLLIDSWFDDGGGTGLRVSWTLVVEIAFYLLILPVGWLVLRAGPPPARRVDLRVRRAARLRVLGARAHDPAPHRSVGAGPAPVPAGVRRRDALRGGRGRRRARHLARRHRPRGALGRRRGPCSAGGWRRWPSSPWSCSSSRTSPPRRSCSGRDRTLQSFLQVAIGALLLAPIALRGATVPFLSSRPLVALAAVSFGFFLWHIQALRVRAAAARRLRAGGRRRTGPGAGAVLPGRRAEPPVRRGARTPGHRRVTGPPACLGGRDRRRSGDLALFRRALCQLSYPTSILCGPDGI